MVSLLHSLSNHLYWLAKGKPAGRKKWSFLNNNQLDQGDEHQLAAIGKTDTIMVGILK